MKKVPHLTAAESRAQVAYLRCLGHSVEHHHLPGVGIIVIKSQKPVRRPKKRCKKP